MASTSHLDNQNRTVLLCLTIAMLTGCAGSAGTFYPVTTGHRASMPGEDWDKHFHVLVWGNHPGAVHALMLSLQREGHIVVNPARLQEIFAEQQTPFTQSSADEADILHVGKVTGAELVMLVEVGMGTEVINQKYDSAYGNGGSSHTLYHVNVAVRGVNVQTGVTRWDGSAYYPKPITNPDQGAVSLAQAAMSHALCPVESGYQWVEHTSEYGEHGCIKN